MNLIPLVDNIKIISANIEKQKRKEELDEEEDLNLTGQPLGCSFTLDSNDSLIDDNARRFGRRR